MGHELTPKSGSYLPVEEVVTRLQREFLVVEISREQAIAEIDGMLKYGEQLAARGVQEAEGVTKRLREVRDSSVMIGLADKKRSIGKAYLSFLLKPGHPIFVDYEGGRHESAAKPLLKRAAAALEYSITVV